MTRRHAGMWGGLALLLAVFTGLVSQKERVLREGEPLLLQLRPVDPRSLIEGDYMRLRYAVEASDDWPADGRLVVRRDADGVGQLVGLFHPGDRLGEGEYALRYRRRQFRTRLGAEAYYFEEGQAARFSAAKYGELRVAPSGESILVGLCDEHRMRIPDGKADPWPEGTP